MKINNNNSKARNQKSKVSFSVKTQKPKFKQTDLKCISSHWVSSCLPMPYGMLCVTCEVPATRAELLRRVMPNPACAPHGGGYIQEQLS